MKKTTKRHGSKRSTTKHRAAKTKKDFTKNIQEQLDEALDAAFASAVTSKDISTLVGIINTVAADFKYVIQIAPGFQALVVDPFGKAAFHDVAALKVDVLTASGAPLIFKPLNGSLIDVRDLDGFVGVFGPAETATNVHRNIILKALSKEIEEIVEAQRAKLSPTVRAHVFGPQKGTLESVFAIDGIKRVEEMTDDEYAAFREGLTDEECAFTDTARMATRDLAPEPAPDASAPAATQNAPPKVS